MNVFRAISIIKLDRNDSQKSQKRKINLISEVIINESTELMMPVFYSVCMVMAYIGPNSKIIGNIGNSSWHFSAIENIYESLLWILAIFSVDLGSCLLTFILIWWFTKINIFKIYLQMQKLMWYTLAIHQGYMVAEVYFLINIHNKITIIDIYDIWNIHIFIPNIIILSVLFSTTNIYRRRFLLWLRMALKK